jgi:hypothetical protein
VLDEPPYREVAEFGINFAAQRNFGAKSVHRSADHQLVGVVEHVSLDGFERVQPNFSRPSFT